MLYTFGSTPKYAGKECTLLIFSIKVARLKEEGLHWPLHVYGLIAIRDSVDPRRNLLFHRTRDNCQTITEGVCDHVIFLSCFSIICLRIIVDALFICICMCKSIEVCICICFSYAVYFVFSFCTANSLLKIKLVVSSFYHLHLTLIVMYLICP